MGTSHQVRVRWRTNVPTDSRVRYGTTEGALDLVADEPTETTEHEVLLSGLSAGVALITGLVLAVALLYFILRDGAGFWGWILRRFSPDIRPTIDRAGRRSWRVLGGFVRGTALIALSGAAAIVGHIYPVWLRFHGGKGVAVAAGVFTMLSPMAAATAAVLFLLIAWVTRYVSLASIAATIALPPAAWILGSPLPVVLVAGGAAVLILFRHRANWYRLRTGTERRVGVRA